MTHEQIDGATLSFFGRPAAEVAPEISQKWYLSDQRPKDAVPGQGATIHISSDSDGGDFKVLLVQAYSADIPGRLWKGKRLQELQALPAGAIKAYGNREGVLPFIVAKGGDNLAIRVLENISTGERLRNATEVSTALGLKHGEEGRLTMTAPNYFTYEKIQKPK